MMKLLSPSSKSAVARLVCLIAMLGYAVVSSAANDIAKPRLLDLSGWAPSSQSPVSLNGPWQVVWNELVEPDDFDARHDGSEVALPMRWQESTHPNGLGVATYRLQLKLPETQVALAIHMIAAHSAYRIYIDGDVAVDNGRVAENPSDFRASYVSRIISVPSSSKELVLQVANFSHAYGGPGHALNLWEAAQLEQSLDLHTIIYSLILGLMFSIAVFHLVLYLSDYAGKSSIVHLWFALLCAVIVYRVQGIMPYLYQYYPDISYWDDLRFAYGSLYLAPVFYLLFFRALFSSQVPRRLTHAFIAICLVGLLLTLVVSEPTYTSTRDFVIWLNVVAIAYSLWFSVKAMLEREAGAAVITGTNLVFLFTAIWDASIYTDQQSGFDLTPFGIAVLGLGYSYVLLLRLQEKFKEARNTSLELESLNLNLEQQVRDRTRSFELAAKRAQGAADEKARFIAAASHDLRQPLHALALFTKTLMHRLSNSPNAELVERQETAISQLGVLLQDTLDAARLNVLEKPLSLDEIQFDDVRELLFQNFSAKAAQRSIRLSIQSDGGAIVSDGSMLQRILSNLLENAISAAAHAVTISLQSDANGGEIVVWNDGKTIPRKDIQRVFESYVSLTGEETQGYGLGLYVVREFSTALDGHVSVTSSSDAGTRFLVTIPSKADVQSSARQDFSLESHLVTLADKKILLIDDDESILTAMQALLEEWQCQVKSASTWCDAEKILSEFSPDLALVDFHLQEMTGIAVKQRMETQLRTNFPVIFVTGATEPEIIADIKDLDSHVLEKPIVPDELAAMMVRSFAASNVTAS
ncbi:MAG: ATP-binding protein [Pseudomonadota bacterium]